MRKILGASMILMFGLGLTACGGDGDGKKASDGQTVSADQGVKYARCMREHGVDMPDPKAGGGGMAITVDGSNPKFNEAQKACKEFAPKLDGKEGKMSPEEIAQLVKYSKCMRDNGVDMPDPKPDGSMMARALPAEDMGKVEAADKKCAEFRPGGK